MITETNKMFILKNVKNFDLAQTLDCGQAFRWSCDESGVWRGIVEEKIISLENAGNDIIIRGCNEAEFNEFWADYFDLSRDYGKIIHEISDNATMKRAAEFGSGIRILKQKPWEALCSFIISQNNNIPRIKGIIERLCKEFGKPKNGFYTFPSAKRLAALTPDDLAPIRAGFRAKYIIDAARKIDSGELDLESLKNADYEVALEKLMSIKGVGPKVADCAMLYGLGRIDAFPRDVWIKRALSEFFDGELPASALPYAGIAQQYIFYYIRGLEK